VIDAVRPKLLATLAGEYAATLGTGITDKNRHIRAELLTILCLSGMSPRHVFEQFVDAEPRSKALVQRHWVSIQAVAERLCVDRDLSGDEFRTLISTTAPDSTTFAA
jgi:hypothetical protein